MIGEGVSLHQKAEFEVQIDGMDSPVGFQKAGPFSVKHGESKYKEGGAKLPHKELAGAEYEDITLERGSSEDEGFNDWNTECLNAETGTGEVAYKRNLTITQLNRAGEPVVRYRVHQAYIKEFSPADFDATSEDFQIEKVVLGCAYWIREVVG